MGEILEEMMILDGKSIYNGYAIGEIHFYGKSAQVVRRDKIDDPKAELDRYEKAKAEAANQLHQLYEKAVKEVGEVNAQIFEFHIMMMDDEDYNDSVKHMIEGQSVNAEYAVASTAENFSAMFANMDDDYFKARSIDVKDVSERLIHILKDNRNDTTLTKPCIIMAEDLTPSETVQMDKQFMLGMVTHLGSANSHTAILARTMNIPALINVEIDASYDGAMAIVDGYAGKMILNPDEDTLAEYQAKINAEKERRSLLQQMKGKETINKYGKKIHLYANIGELSDLASVLSNDAEGIGLFRSEFLYLKEDDFPTEDALFMAYKQVAETMVGKKVIIRTMDIGADKKVDYFHLKPEENPAMGYRAIRICLTREDIFKTQIRAILRASAYGNISVMYPMITSLWEVKKIKEIVTGVRKELEDLGILCGNFEQGIMIETPAAAMISDILAKEVDFFSIGTNDLTQYTLAVDRQNPALDTFYDSHHEAVLRMIRMTVENGHKEGIWVGICGELGADTSLADAFMEMGVDELSVSPSKVLAVRKAIIGEGKE